MSKPRAAKRAPAHPKAPPVAEHFLTGSPAAAYTYFLPAAQALPPERVRSFRLDLTIAQNNLALGLQAVLPELPRLIKELPALPIAELAELPMRFAAVRHATARLADLGPGSSDSFAIRYARARELREPLLDFAEVLVRLKLLPAGGSAASAPAPAPLMRVRTASILRSCSSSLPPSSKASRRSTRPTWMQPRRRGGPSRGSRHRLAGARPTAMIW